MGSNTQRIAELEADLKSAWATNRAIDKARMEDRAKWEKDAVRWKFQSEQPDLTPYLREYHSGVMLSTEAVDSAMGEVK